MNTANQWAEIRQLLQGVPNLSTEHRRAMADPATWAGAYSRTGVYRLAGEVLGHRPIGTARTDDGRKGFIALLIGEIIADALGIQARNGPVPKTATLLHYMMASHTRKRNNAYSRKFQAKSAKQGRENPQYPHRPSIRKRLDSILEAVGCFVDLPDGEAGKNAKTKIPVGCGEHPPETILQNDILHKGHAHSKAEKSTCVYVVGLVSDSGPRCGKYGCTDAWSPRIRLCNRRNQGFDISEAHTFWFRTRDAAFAAERELADFVNGLPEGEFDLAMPERAPGYGEQFAQQCLAEVLNKAREIWESCPHSCNLPGYIPYRDDVLPADRPVPHHSNNDE